MRAANLCIWASLAILLVMVTGLLYAGLAQEDDISELKGLILSFEDVRMSVRDLAFYLATHNYDSKPDDGYVALEIDGKRFHLVPNGAAPGICDIYPAN